MTAEWITTAALDHTDDVMDRIHPAEASRYEVSAAFIAGVELGIAKAARLAELNEDDDLCQADCHEADARAIRALGSDENEERADG